jgi:yopX protein
MNREILFRAKCFGNWRYGSYVHFVKKPTNSRCNINYKDFIITNEEDGEHYYPITDLSSIGQYTGLKDKNGKEIYEGDIISIGGGGLKAVVIWFKGAFRFRAELNSKAIYFEDIVVIVRDYDVQVVGNVIDNPELIK